MSGETPQKTEKSMPWRWMLFGVGLVAVVTLLTFAAMDRQDVVWESGTPLCPHCRVEVPAYSRLCRTCGQGYDWTTDDRLCGHCLTDSDVARLKSVSKESLEALLTAPGRTGLSPAGVREWMAEIEPGACVYCGGTGHEIWAPRPEESRGGALPPCPICLGEGDCIGCDGDQMVRYGDWGAHQDMRRHQERLANLEGTLGKPAADEVRATAEEAIRNLRGYAEVEAVDTPDGQSFTRRAWARFNEILEVLPLTD